MKNRISFIIFLLLFSSSYTANAQSTTLQFDGIDDRVIIPKGSLDDIGEGDLTIEAWISGEESDQGPHARLFSSRSVILDGMTFQFVGPWGGSEFMMISLAYGQSNHMVINNGEWNGSILDGTCHHVAAVREGESVHFYVDGMFIGSAVKFGNESIASASSHAIIGNDLADEMPFDGSISNLRIWSTARSQEEIMANKDLASPTDNTGLVMSWNLQESAGQEVVDSVSEEIGYLGSSDSDDASDPDWSAESCITSATGVSEFELEHLILYPNPAHDVIRFAWDGQTPEAVHVTDVTGRRAISIRTDQVFSQEVDVHNLSQGVYQLVIEGSAYRAMGSFVKE